MVMRRGRPKSKNAQRTSKEGNLRPWLVKCAFMNRLFGMEGSQDFRHLLAKIEEGNDEDGHSNFYHVLKNHKDFLEKADIKPEKLLQYDDNINMHMRRINSGRDISIRLKYYQWLAALFTEAYLDRYFDSPGKLAGEIEQAVIKYIDKKSQAFDNFGLYSRFMPDIDDLRKCAYWMATGSGKTYLVHLAYLQFRHYNRGSNHIDIDSILLITPNADLTAQHIKEMNKSGIPCEEFDAVGLGGYFQTRSGGDIVNVVEITRLTEDKKDAGVRRVDIESFGRKNLVFVDEAHKGSGGEKWKYFRRELSREGFTFEYSATFGQAAASSPNIEEDNLALFAKTILFDYSYPHFYDDGYGKEYRVLNVNERKYDTDRVLLSNLLTYYEQKLVFNDIQEIAVSNNIANPLWIFVGSKVNVSGTKSDVMTVVRFLQKVLTDRDWVVETTKEFLQGRSGLIHETTKHDIFDPAFPERRLRYLRGCHKSAEEIYNDMLVRVFRCTEPAGLTLVLLKNAEGEIGLRCMDNDFFGDIYVGEASKFISLVEKNEPRIIIEKVDHPSLFRSIDAPESTVNILIGAKKFIEGWDCYRVCSMGLINIGKSEGTEIIQLFGRGIRLKGKNNSLKRSNNDYGDQHPDLPLLETLNIFGVDAKYVGYLRDFLTIEGMDSDNTIEKYIDIDIQTDYLKEGLLVPEWEREGFTRREQFVLTKELLVPVNVDLLTRVESEDSNLYQGAEADFRPESVFIKSSYLNFIDWDQIYFSLLEWRDDKGWKNMIFTKAFLREVIENQEIYKLYCADHMIQPTSFEDMHRLEDVIALILRKIIQASYSRKKNIWIKKNACIKELSKDNGNFSFKRYTLQIKEHEREIIETIENIGANIEAFLQDESSKFVTNVYLDTHLFQPLLAKTEKGSEKILISPAGLNEGEEKFVKHLYNFVKDQENASFFKENKLFLLRNIPKKGIGFYQGISWFYPDFILWIKNAKTEAQRLIFVDPKGLTWVNGFDDPKIRLCHDIKEFEKELRKKSGKNDLILDSYILSLKSRLEIAFESALPEKFDSEHILFMKSERYIKKMLLID